MLRRLLASLALALFTSALLGGASPALAGPEPAAVLLPTTCADGLGVGHVELLAADGAETTFTTTVSSYSLGQVFADDPREVAAGESFVLDIPDLFYGDYAVRVTSDGSQVLVATLEVTCIPTQPYDQASWHGSIGCNRTTAYTVSNTPIPGAEDLLRPVRFKVILPGGPTYLDTELPDADDNPYEAVVAVPWDDDAGATSSADAQVTVTADGEPLDASSWVAASCERPEEPQVKAPLPNTGG